MLKIKRTSLYGVLSLVITLVGCTSNDSSTIIGAAPVIDPVEVNKTIEVVDWTAENYVGNVSHAYRVATQNTMLRLVLTNQIAAFDAVVNLLGVNSSRNCLNSGRMIAENIEEVCFIDSEEKFEGVETTCDQSAVLRRGEQVSRAFACQDGAATGKYFNGFFSTIQKEDLTDLTERKTSSTISALGETTTFDEDGNIIVDEFGDPVMDQLTNYLFQSDGSRFFFDNKYEAYVDYSRTKLVCGANEYITVVRQGVRSAEVGTQEGNGTSNFYIYTKLTDLNLEAIPTETCAAEDKQTVTYTYNLTTTMANAVMGGGVDRNTFVTWPNMNINQAGEPSGIMTLVHQNANGDYTVTVDFNTVGQVTISTPDVANPSTLTVSEFLVLSNPEFPFDD